MSSLQHPRTWSSLALGQLLWSWKLCSDCLGGRQCVDHECPGRRQNQLQRYFAFCKANVEAQDAEQRLNELAETICGLKQNPHVSREDLRQIVSEAQQSTSLVNQHEHDGTIALAVRLLTTIDCSPLHRGSDRLERGRSRSHWPDGVPFDEYLKSLFPVDESIDARDKLDSDFTSNLKALRATKLIKHLQITIVETNDIQDHLHLDRDRNILQVFHHAAFLKEQLRLTKNITPLPEFPSSLRIGALPRQLALEVLDSLQSILFPLSDAKSKRMLQSLVARGSFDPDILKFEPSSICNIGETVSHVYLAERLSELYHELQNPTPRGWLERRMQRRSSARHIMMATLLGVVFAVLLGMASLAVSSYQSWIAYQAWQHPVAPPVPE